MFMFLIGRVRNVFSYEQTLFIWCCFEEIKSVKIWNSLQFNKISIHVPIFTFKYHKFYLINNFTIWAYFSSHAFHHTKLPFVQFLHMNFFTLGNRLKQTEWIFKGYLWFCLGGGSFWKNSTKSKEKLKIWGWKL